MAARVVSIDRRNDLVETHLELVRAIAGSLLRLFPPSIEYDDLVSQGNMGLLRAAEMFDPSRGVTFAAYAKKRVRGAIMDANRRRHYLNATHAPLSDATEQSELPGHEEAIDRKRMARQVNNVIVMLKPRERGIIQRYYGAEQSSKQIAQEAGMLTPRVGEIRRAAVIEMRRGLERRGIKKAA